MAAKAKKISLADFPEEVDSANGIKIYGETSYENQMAVLSHYLHNHRREISKEEQAEITAAIREYLSRKEARLQIDVDGMTDEQVLQVAENPTQYDLFSDFLNVPFPAPENPKFTFIDLFAGIGGIRIPFDEMGYQCVFSSEWDAKACKTYLANFGTLPFGDITKESTKSYIPENFDVLCAGFPCQPFPIAGVSKKKSLGRETGFKDKTQGTLFFDVADIICRHRPKAFYLENVKNLTSHDKGNTFRIIRETLEELDYSIHYQVMDGQTYVPQHRERIMIVGFDKRMFHGNEQFNFPEHHSATMTVKDILDPNIDEKYNIAA